jgi:hypothetical protein
VIAAARQSQDGTVGKGLRRPRLGAIIISLRSPTLILIAAPFHPDCRAIPDLKFPFSIVTRRSAPFPENTKIDGYQVYVWEILSLGNRSTFLGRDMENRFSY